MMRKGKKGRVGAKVFAALLAAALTFSNVSMALPGGMAMATEQPADQTLTSDAATEGAVAEAGAQDTEDDENDGNEAGAGQVKDEEAGLRQTEAVETEGAETVAQETGTAVTAEAAAESDISAASVVTAAATAETTDAAVEAEDNNEDLVETVFELQGISDEDLDNFKKDAILSCIPEDGSETRTASLDDNGNYSVTVKKYVSYNLELAGVENYRLLTLSFTKFNPVEGEEPVVLSFEALPTEEANDGSENNGRMIDDSKPDVWDFGAENLGDEYNNRLDADVINGFYSVAAGSTGANIASFSVDDGDFEFNDGGYPTTHRLRSTNKNITRYDEKSLKDSDGNVYSGYIYSNKGSTDSVYVALECKTDDVITVYAASNGTDSDIHFRNMSNESDDSVMTHTLGSGTVSKMVFYPTDDARYKLFSSSEKLVVARVIREHAEYGTLTGTVNGYEGKDPLTVVFTNKLNGNVIEAEVADGAFYATLAEGFEYELSLKGADDYAIASPKTVTINGDESIDLNLVGVDLVSVSGKLSGIAEGDVQKFASAAEFTFKPQDEASVYVPKISLQAGDSEISYELKLQSGITYDVSVADKKGDDKDKYAAVEDYNLLTQKLTVSESSEDLEIEFEAKPVYKVTIAPVGASLSDLSEANFKFTRLDAENDYKEDGYVYEFTGTDNIALRDGQYAVEVTGAGAFVQKLTSNLTVEGADVTKEISFASDITEWDFSDAAFAAKFAGVTEGTYNGLSWTNGRSHNGVYLYSGAGKISVPVKGDCQIQVTANYQYSYYFDNENEVSVNVKTGSTSQNDVFTYDYKGGEGSFDITVLGSSYITKIATVYQTEYKSELTVGASQNADFATIGEALEAVRRMDRGSDRVTISIEPGNYEEMLVIDVPNVTLQNAVSGANITPVNKGVDIASDSVRITWYYGHGYTYYSMGSDCKYDEELLEVNKANRYASFVNPGSGTTAGSYWNASVVISAAGFEAKDIIFENSFNQYMSEKAAEDVIVPQNGAKEGDVARAGMSAGDTTVQHKKYVERAAAVAMTKSAQEAYFDHCAFIGRQDTLYGAEGSTEAYYNCDIYGGTDFIFGGMTAVFAKCNLVMNTSEDSNDVSYITAAQQSSDSTRGYLMYNCKVTSTVPGENTASQYASKPGYFGRPWKADTSEVVYYNTVIDATCSEYRDISASLISPEGWNNTLSGTTKRNVEYGTYEMADGVDNSAARADWAPVSDVSQTTDGKEISVSTFLGNWDPFDGKDMNVVLPDGKVVVEPEEENETETTLFTFESKDLTAFSAGAKADGVTEKAGTEDYFTLIYSAKSKVDSSKKTFEDEYYSEQRLNFGGKPFIEGGEVKTNAVKFKTSNAATVKVWWVANKDTYQMALLNSTGDKISATSEATTANTPYISKFKVDEAGTYYLGGDDVNNYIFKIEVEEEKAAEPVEYELEASLLDTFSAGAKADGESEKAGTENYFTVLYSAKSKIDTSTKTWEDGYTSGVRINFGGAASTEKNSIKFTTSNDNAELKIWWASNAREMVVLNAQGNTAYKTESGAVKNEPYISTITLAKAGTYYLGGDGGTNYIFKVQVTDGTPAEVVRTDWSSVEAPVIENVALNSANAGKIDVTVKAVVGVNGGDRLAVTMYDADNKEVKTLKSSAEKDSFDIAFEPSLSGDYHFVATLSRDDEETVKTSDESDAFAFVYPLTAPAFKSVVNKGSGTVQVKFYSVAEATGYTIIATNKSNETGKSSRDTYKPGEVVDNVKTEYSYTFVGLDVGDTYEISLVATRDRIEDGKTVTDTSEVSAQEVVVTSDSEREWVFSAFGLGVTDSTANNGYEEKDDGSITVWCLKNKGKIVPGSTDGLSFYYTAVPSDMNFTLTATATIDTWAFTNGQEGFGLMAADRVGVNGDSSTFWNNSYMASGTKVEYFYDADKGEATQDETGTKITMKLGLGAQEKVGVTNDNLALFEANDTDTVTGAFSSKMYPLETSCAAFGTGTYNLFGNEKSGTTTGTVDNPVTRVRLRIQKNNTGYFVSYLDDDGNVLTTKKFYDTEALSQIDADNVYVGFYASRTFKANFSDIELTLTNPEDDAPAEERPVEYVAPNYKVVSATYSNTAKYELSYVGNADGVLTITDDSGKELVSAQTVEADKQVSVTTRLKKGDNKFTIKFIPDEFFNPEGNPYKKLSSYEMAEFEHVVNYETINDDEKIYVTQNGSADAEGTQADPVDIYTAVKYVQPGQTIVLASGTYNLSSTVKVDRGIDGTPDKPIRMVAEGGRAIFDFGQKCAGFIFAGNYWNVNGIDCTRSANSQKGIQVSGSHITLEDIRTYENGNTGIQVSRYLSTDDRDLWPSYDLILNCTSYSNADAGYEDADGFAAKLTCGEGIVFDGCIAYNNADDGWDLFAKVETGSIGQVTIQDCVAFDNGYGVDGTNEGNGNGFKMGGSSIAGNHKLINSVAWDNKAKGIDSNSGPDIQVYNSMSFNNGSNNVALYTNDTANTNYYVDGVISFRTDNTGTNENIKPKGTQDENNIYGSLNFFWNDNKSSNKDGLTVTEDWFVSLSAPKADAQNPIAVAESLRAADGSIDLGDFMKLSETGLKALADAGLDAKDIVADLEGDYASIKDERDINGSSEAADKDKENPEAGGTESGEAGEGSSSEPGSGSSSDSGSGSSSESGSGSSSESGSGSSSESGSGSSSDSGSGSSSESGSGSSSESESGSSSESGSGNSSDSGDNTGSGSSSESGSGSDSGSANTGSSSDSGSASNSDSSTSDSESANTGSTSDSESTGNSDSSASGSGSESSSSGSGSAGSSSTGSTGSSSGSTGSTSSGASSSSGSTSSGAGSSSASSATSGSTTGAETGTTTGGNTSVTGNTGNNDDTSVAGATREESQTTETQPADSQSTEGQATDTPSADNGNQQSIPEQQQPTSDKPENPGRPVSPVLPIAGATVVVIAAAGIAIKTGFLAKILAILHIVK